MKWIIDKTRFLLGTLLAVFTVNAFSYDYNDGTLQYSILQDWEGNCVEVTGHTWWADSVVVPPHIEINGQQFDVVSIGTDGLGISEYLQRIELPCTLRRIGEYGISCTTSLLAFRIPDSVLEIKGCAIYHNNQLKMIVIPDKVEKLGYGALENNPLLHTVVLGKGIKELEYWALRDLPELKELYVLCPTPPELWQGPFIRSGNENTIVYVPEGCIDQYRNWGQEETKASIKGADLSSRRNPGEYDDNWDSWKNFHEFRPIPDLFVILEDYTYTIEEGRSEALFYETVNYANVEIYSERWDFDSEYISLEGDVITGKKIGETTFKRVVETSTGTYESKPATVIVKEYDPSGIGDIAVKESPHPTAVSEQHSAPGIYYSIDGRSAGNDALRLAPGVYVELRDGKVRKFVKR